MKEIGADEVGELNADVTVREGAAGNVFALDLDADARVVNLYGPTEVTVDATSFDAVTTDGTRALVAGPAMPIGHPACNVTARVLDQFGLDVPGFRRWKEADPA